MATLNEHDKALIDQLAESRKEAFTLAEWVEIPKGKKGEKSEKAVVCISKFRLLVVKMHKKKTEVTSEVNLMDIKAVELNDKEFTLKLTPGSAAPLQFNGTNTSDIVIQVKQNLAACFPDAVEEVLEWKLGSFEVPLAPASRPCGNFCEAYMMLCDLEGVPCREDIIWDIQNVVDKNRYKTFTFDRFLPLSEKDLRPILGALSFNQYFEQLVLDGSSDDFPVEKEFNSIANIFRTNRRIFSLQLSHFKNIDEKLANLFSQLQQNPSLSAIHLDDCQWESSKVLTSMTAWLSKKLISELTLNNLTIKKAGPLFEVLSKSPHPPGSALTKLNLENNKMDQPSMDKLIEMLQDNCTLTVLNLSNTGILLPPLFGSLSENKPPLSYLNISNNKIKKKQTIQPILDYLAECSLETLDISSTDFPLSTLESILTAIVGNSHLKNFHLIMNSNKLEKEGAEVFGRVIKGPADHIKKISMKGCELGDEGLRVLLKALQPLNKLSELDLSFNLKHPKGPGDKDRESTVTAIAEFMDFKGNNLEVFKIAGQKGYEIGEQLDIVFKKMVVGENVRITSLDVSGNASGDSGALALAKALERTTTLQHLAFDKNGTTLRGFLWLKNGISNNKSLKSMDVPLFDLGAIGGDPEKIKHDATWHEISDILRTRLPKSEKPALELSLVSPKSDDKIKSPRKNKKKHDKLDVPSSPRRRAPDEKSGDIEESSKRPSRGVPATPTPASNSTPTPAQTPLSVTAELDESAAKRPSRVVPATPTPTPVQATPNPTPAPTPTHFSYPYSNPVPTPTPTPNPTPAAAIRASKASAATPISVSKGNEEKAPRSVPPTPKTDPDATPAKVQNLAAMLGGALSPPGTPMPTPEPKSPQIVKIENSNVTISASPRLANVQRAKGPANKRPPQKPGAIGGALAEQND